VYSKPTEERTKIRTKIQKSQPEKGECKYDFVLE
jgi:hypothetical protein